MVLFGAIAAGATLLVLIVRHYQRQWPNRGHGDAYFQSREIHY